MREMFRQFFSAITTLFRAFERSANVVDNYAKWAEIESSAFEQQAAIERQNELNLLRGPSN